MDYRLTKICTRTGDKGITVLGDGMRISKDSSRIHALGDVDELNCALGVLLSLNLTEPYHSAITLIQKELFDLGAELALPGHIALSESRVTRLEQTLVNINVDLPPLREFILPGGCPAAAACHFARAVCRRTERAVVALAQIDAVNPLAIRYLNRLADLLFVMARALNHGAGRSDILWKSTPTRD